MAQVHAYYVGLNLKLPTDLLDSIESQYPNSRDRLLHVLKEFLRRVEPRPTWLAVVNALRSPSVGLLKLAEKFEKKYCSTPESELGKGMYVYQKGKTFKNEQKEGMLQHKRANASGIGISNMRKSIYLLTTTPTNHTYTF